MALDHYVSQVHLKRFYSPVLDNRMYAIRKSDLRQFTTNSRSVCRIDEGNTNEYLREPRVIEEFLKTVEGGYNAAVLALERGIPDRKSIYVLAGFVSYIMTCSPAAMRINSVPLEGVSEMIARSADRQELIPPPPAELGGNNLTELLETDKVKLKIDPKYPQAINVANILDRIAKFGNFHWEALVNTHENSPYFTSDFPVAFETTADEGALNRIVPLSPNIALRIRPRISLSDQLMNFDFRYFSFELREVKRNEVVDINRLLVRSAEDTVFYRDDRNWIPDFVRRNRDFWVETKIVEIPQPKGTLLWFQQAIRAHQHE